MGRRKSQVFSITKNAYVVKSILIKRKIPYQSLYSLYERLCNSSCKVKIVLFNYIPSLNGIPVQHLNQSTFSFEFVYIYIYKCTTLRIDPFEQTQNLHLTTN